MSKIVETISRMENLLPLKAASIEEVENAEIELALPFAKEYKEYLLEFGAVMADDVELTGIAKANSRNVVCVTKREWSANSNIKHNMYVVENLSIDGIIIWQDNSGKIYESRPNHGATKIADSLAEYLNSKNE